MRRTALAALLVVLLALPNFWRLDAEEFHGDESHWISSGQQAFYLFSHGQWLDPQWREEFYLYSQPQIGKLAIGAALATAGIAGPTRIYDYDWQLLPAQNRTVGRVPSPEAIVAGRTAGALAGWLGCLALWALGAALGVPLAGAIGAVLLASHPLWLANSRRAGLDDAALAIGLLAAGIAVRSVRRPMGWRTTGLLLVSGLLVGLAVGTKYVALLVTPVLLVPFLVALGTGGRRASIRRRAGLLIALSLAGGLAGATFWITDPTLYHDPAAGLAASVDFLTRQAAEMRARSPVFNNPGLTAAEVVDRVVWPLGFPVVVDLTLPEPLVPGSYGTPFVAFGAVLAVWALLRAAVARRPSPELAPAAGPPLVVVLAWTAVVYLALVISVPIWWERWHLPLVPPLCLLAGIGLTSVGRRPVAVAILAGAAQYVAALAMGPSYLGRGFGALLGTPAGAAAHVAALAMAIALFLVHSPVCTRLRAVWRERWQTAAVPETSYASASSVPVASPRERTSPDTGAPKGSSSTPPVT